MCRAAPAPRLRPRSAYVVSVRMNLRRGRRRRPHASRADRRRESYGRASRPPPFECERRRAFVRPARRARLVAHVGREAVLDLVEAEELAVRAHEDVPGQEKGERFPTSEAHISIVFHSIWLIFRRAIISRDELKAWMFLS